MPSDWIKADKKLADGPKVLRIVELTGLDRDTILGRLWRFWSWVDDHARDGGELRVSRNALRNVTRNAAGNDDGFLDALMDPQVNWLQETPSGLLIPNWGKWFGRSRKERVSNAERQKRWREKNESVTSPLRNAPRNALCNALDQTRPDETLNTGSNGASIKGEPATPASSSAGEPGAGACADEDQTRTKTRPSVFDGVTVDVLRDNAKLDSWSRYAAGKRKPVVSRSDRDLLWVYAAAERALEVADNPPAMFASLIADDLRANVSQDQEERARRRLRELSGVPTKRPRPKPEEVDAEVERNRKAGLAALGAKPP